MIRLFVALKIPEKIKVQLFKICSQLVTDASFYKWELKDKIHLTLKFIGEVEENLLPLISTELDFVKNYRSFHFNISRFGFFFRDNRPKILWAGLKTDDSIFKLVEELNKRMEIFNIEPERREFKSHLTLLRIKSNLDNNFMNNFKNYQFDNLNFKANEIALVKSELSRTGAQYTEINNYELN
jgi:2'-5' RNA ligase